MYCQRTVGLEMTKLQDSQSAEKLAKYMEQKLFKQCNTASKIRNAKNNLGMSHGIKQLGIKSDNKRQFTMLSVLHAVFHPILTSCKLNSFNHEYEYLSHSPINTFKQLFIQAVRHHIRIVCNSISLNHVENKILHPTITTIFPFITSCIYSFIFYLRGFNSLILLNKSNNSFNDLFLSTINPACHHSFTQFLH
ncbi:hypothetical protein EGR_05974 [Echinococcus granulosus]|uniref:Uncharacterized protein n=1 Tax=Echinococcus granulosus TaxID=6210 RepID=W6UEC6_ECHGR|nr:hypothetical protein EGR_05974 [Echinococcus granulosus]EUB59246.1 hypothetical protein EGR_05974 [Echinococcus granulosus]